ncbi:MAG TPA: DUF3330 domain-containing protein [Thiobacillus sp.]|nr:DUF3330 domain-containing protein [Thiobacillus sp.]
MDKQHRSPAGARVAQCSDEDSCTVVSCEVCLKEVPADAVKVTDAQDYVHHFCGLDCLEAWQKQAGIQQQAGPERRPDRLK